MSALLYSLILAVALLACDHLVCLQAVVDAVLAIAKPNEPTDLYMVEIMEMKHKTDCDTQ